MTDSFIRAVHPGGDLWKGRRSYRTLDAALTHAEAVRVILEESDGQFDPAVVRGFSTCQDEFGKIYHQVRN